MQLNDNLFSKLFFVFFKQIRLLLERKNVAVQKW